MEYEKNTETLTDEALIHLTLNNDKNYYRYIVDRYTEKLSRYTRRITSLDDDDIKDIIQTTFIKAYTNLNDFDITLSFSSWIYRITHNETITFIRKNKHTVRLQIEDDDLNIFENIADEANLEIEFDIKIKQEEVKKKLNSISAEYREILILRFFEEKSYQEISDILKKPIGTISTMIHRAKHQFLQHAK